MPPNSGVYILDRDLRIISAYGSLAATPDDCAGLPAGKCFQDLIPLPDQDNTVPKIMVVARDVTARKRREAALAEAERFARATIDSLHSHIAIVDAKGTILAVNQAWRDFAASNGQAGARPGEGANYFDVCASAVGPGSDDALAFLAAMRTVLAGELDEAALEYPCHSPGNSVGSPLTSSPFRAKARAASSSRMRPSPRKLMEIALREREARYRSLFENNHCVMLLTDPGTGAHSPIGHSTTL